MSRGSVPLADPHRLAPHERRLLALFAVVAFVAAFGGMAMPGAVPYLIDDGGLTAADIGTSGVVFGVVFAVSAPVVAVLARRTDPARVALVGLPVYAAGLVALGVAGDVTAFTAGRVLHALGVAAVTPQLTILVGRLVPAQRRSRALSVLFTGLVVASLLGAPLANLVAFWLGVRWVFFSTAVAALVLAALLGLVVRRWARRPAPPAAASGAGGVAATAWLVVAATLVTALLEAVGGTTLMTFLSPVVTALTGLTGEPLSLVLLCYGAAGIAGNAVLGRLVDRLGAGRCLLAMQLLATLALLAVPHATSVGVLAPLLAVWGFASWGLNPALQSMIIGHGAAHSGVLVAANSSLIYLGMGLGNGVGAAAMAAGGSAAVPSAAAALMAASILTASVAALAARRRPSGVGPAVVDTPAQVGAR